MHIAKGSYREAKRSQLRFRFVKIKVPFQTETASNIFVQASARARCLAQPAVDEQLLLHMNIGSSISAIEYRVSCQAPPADLPADWSQAQQVAVICRFPETVAPMRQIAQPGTSLVHILDHDMCHFRLKTTFTGTNRVVTSACWLCYCIS